MKALTIKQPHASLIAAGLKIYETRTWRPPADLIGKRIAIHAGMGCETKRYIFQRRRLCIYHPPEQAQSVSSFFAILDEGRNGELPQGNILGTALLKEVHLTDNLVEPATGITYDKGLFAWELSDFVPLEPPQPAKGQQRLWNWRQPA